VCVCVCESVGLGGVVGRGMEKGGQSFSRLCCSRLLTVTLGQSFATLLQIPADYQQATIFVHVEYVV